MPDAADRVRMALAEAGSDLEVVAHARYGGIVHARRDGGTVGDLTDADRRLVAKAYAVADVDDLERCWVCGPEES